MFVITNATTLLTLVICVFYLFFFFITIIRALSNLCVFSKNHIWSCWLSLFHVDFLFQWLLLRSLYLLTSTFLGFTLLYTTFRHPQGKVVPNLRLCTWAWEFFTVLLAFQYLQMDVFKCWKSSVFLLYSKRALIHVIKSSITKTRSPQLFIYDIFLDNELPYGFFPEKFPND